MPVLNTYRMEAFAKDNPTTYRRSSDNRFLPPLILSAYFPVSRPTYPQVRMIKTRAMIAEREVQIRALEMKIRDLGATVDAEGQDEFPLSTDHFNSRILAIQKEMEDHWNAFLAERQKAEAVAVAKVTDFEMQIHALLQWPVS